MSLFQIMKRKKGEVDAGLISQVRKELEAKYSRTVHMTAFLMPKEVKEILTRDRVRELFKKLSWYSEDDRDVLWPRMCSIICILITINFDLWDDFRSLFFSINQSGKLVPRLVDSNLPIQDVSWLPTHLQTHFQRQQYTFTPIVFEKDTHREYDANQRLPILREERIAGRGAQGTVDKVYVQKGYLQTSPYTHNSEVQVMARKKFTSGTERSQKSFSTERHILEQFRKSQTFHQNIMQSFATFLHGSDFVILSDWAEWGDLSQFLEIPDQVVENYFSHSARFTPHNLLMQVASLADALDYLHYRMGNNRGARFQFAHLDLKPENILVFMPQSSNPADTPVGQWKITDFGLSNVELSVTRGGAIVAEPPTTSRDFLAPGRLLGELSWRPLKRGAGPYQPPEVRDADVAKVSTGRDVWSFGCILAMVLAFAIGGPEEVRNQCRCRSSGTDDYFYMRLSEDYLSDSMDPQNAGWVDAQLKPEIKSWLVEYAPSRVPSNHSTWVSYWTWLVLSLLEVDVKKRPSIKQAVIDMHALLDYTEKASYRLWDFERSTLTPDPRPVIPEMQVTSDTDSIDSPGPHIGIRTNSSGSSAPPSRSSPSIGPFSISSSHRSDPLSRYMKIETPYQCRSANICPSGSSVAFWNNREFCVYYIGGISDDDNQLWQHKSRSIANLSASRMPHSVYRSAVPSGSTCQKVALNGPFMALLLFVHPSTYTIHVYRRAAVSQTEPIRFDISTEKTFTSVPDDFKLSTGGSCLVRLPNEIHFITLDGSVGIPVQNYEEVMGYDFTSDGRFFCTWVRHESQHYWNIRDYRGRMLGERINHDWTPTRRGRPTHEAFLFPFHRYPRFIACDKHGNIFLIRADAVDDSVQRVGRTENVYTGMMLPDDGAFLIVRQTQHEHQRLQRTNLTVMSNRVQPSSYECGKLPVNMDKSTSGICVRANQGIEGGLCVLTISRSGLLIRKILRQ